VQLAGVAEGDLDGHERLVAGRSEVRLLRSAGLDEVC
jgi:hypothetical protein